MYRVEFNRSTAHGPKGGRLHESAGAALFSRGGGDGEFSPRGEKLFITQQTLSAHIQKLESRYGTPLFERKPHLRLTPAGHCLREYARKAVKLEELFLAELADVTDTVTGRLNVGITGFRATIFMPRIWEIFHAQFPNITPSMTEAPTARLDELLDKGQLDLYIGVDAPVRKTRKRGRFRRKKRAASPAGSSSAGFLTRICCGRRSAASKFPI